MPKRTTSTDRYLNEPVSYGGELLSRAEVWRRLRALCGGPHRPDCRCADYWMMGCDLVARQRAQKTAAPA